MTTQEMSPERPGIRTAFAVALAAMAFLSAFVAVYRAQFSPPPVSNTERDDADAAIRTFGPPDADEVVRHASGDPLADMRLLTYHDRGVRLAFIRRRSRDGARLLWKLIGPADGSGRFALSGEEAVRRLRRRGRESSPP